MPIDRYFDKFPIITYANNQVVDITKRVAILESISKNPYVFYPYEITYDERADQFASRYYEDSYKSWIIYLTNKIIDPYYEWYLSQNQFQEFLSLKYGSIENAYQKIKYYRNNYAETNNISITDYENLTATLKKYWQPNYGINNNITSYTRIEKDWKVNTNKIVCYSVSNSSFTNNEICSITFDAYNSGKGQILYTTNNNIYVQHTSGVTLSNTTVLITGNSYIYGKESGVNTSFSNSTLISQNLAPEEEIYWSPVYEYDYEYEKNEFNKTIRVVDDTLSYTIVKNFKDLMK